jgi:hypothetical protein
MDMRRALVRLTPRSWQERYGEELLALLEDTELTPAAVADVVRAATVLRARAHMRLLLVVATLMVSASAEWVAVRTGITDNILWLPRTPVSFFGLAAVVGPWVALVALAVRRRRLLA